MAIGAVAPASASVVCFKALPNNGYIVPFNPTNWTSVIYADSGWLSASAQPPVTLTKITLEVATYLSNVPGTTDIVFTLNDGDPSGLLFGSGAPLYTVTIPNVPLPAAPIPTATFFQLVIPLPNVQTLGGLNHVGWSVRMQNYNYPGCFGFRMSNCSGQTAGYYTADASYFDGEAWSLLSFGSGCNNVVNYAVTLEASQCSADLDGNGAVDAADLGILLGQWGSVGSADLNASGTVDAADLGVLLGAWGPCT
ncbi:MAG: hypothetical protein U0572_16905 [Phycisphaerales bacterium]